MPVSYKLSKMPQRDFLNIFYSGFYDPEVELEAVGDMKKEVESTKLKIQQMSKIKDEIDKTITKMNDTKRTLDAEKRKMYQDGVRKNVRKVFDMQFKLYKSLQKYGMTGADLGNMRAERTFQKSNYDPNELLEYFDNIKHYQKQARELLGIDMIEARAIYNRVGVFSICEMSEILASYKLRGQLDKVKNILEFPLIREKRVREFIDTVEAIALFSNRFFFDGMQITKKSTEDSEDGNDKEDRNPNKRSKKEEKEAKNAQADNFDNFFKFFPFWDTKFCEGSREDSVFVRKQLDINVVDSYNLSQVMRCETLREMVESYQLNREQQNIPSFTQEEMAKLEQRGLDRLKAERVRSLITFLAKQARAIPSALFNFLGGDKQMYKVDLRGIENVGRLACIAAIFACVLNLQHPLTRVDISGFGCDEDIGSVISLLIRNKRIAIKELQLNGNKLEATGFNQLYKVTSKQANKIPISVFSMNSVSLPLESSLLLPTFVKKADFLRILSLEGNQLQDNIGSLILEFIATSRNLKYINLSDNGLGDKSLDKLITVITKNQTIECVEYEHNMINETRVEMLLDCFRECKTSNLRVLKLGMIQKTANDYSLMFRTGFSFFPKLALGTITIHADLKDQEMSLTTILQENRCLYIINNFTQNHSRSYQSAALNFFTEQLLLTESPKEELLGIYRPLIETFEQKNDIVLMDNMEHLWPKFKSTPIQDSLTKETKETLLCRYLLAVASENYAGIVQLELIYLCLKYLVSLQVCFQDGFNLLHKIIVSRNTLLLEECFKVGMSLNIPTFETNTLIPRMTTLQLILLTKNEEMLTRMLTYKPNVDETDAYGNTLLHYVCLYGMEKLCRRLIELECKCDAENLLGMMALHTAILGNSYACFLIVLNQLGRNTMNDNYVIKQIGTIKQNCLHLSVIYNCSAVFEYCLEVLEDLNVQDAIGKTALMYAVEKGNKLFMMRLMASKVNLFVMDNNKDNLLMYLLAKRDEETFKKILALYDNQIALYKNSKGEDLLYAAAKYNVPNVVKHFLELGISPNEPNMNGVCAKDLIEKNPMLVKEFYKWKSNSQSADATRMQNLTNDSISLPNKHDGSQGDKGNRSILKAGKSNGSSGKIDKTVIVGGSMNKSLDKSLNVSRMPKKLPTSDQNKDYEFVLPKLNPGTLHGTINRGALFVDEKGYWGAEWKDSTANIMKDINSENKKKTYYDLIEEYQRKKRAGQKVDFAKIKSEFDKQKGVQKSTDIYRNDTRKSIMGLPSAGDRKSVLRSRPPRPGSPGAVDKSNVKWWDSQNRGNSGIGKAAQNRTFDSRDYSRGGSRSPDRQNRSMNA